MTLMKETQSQDLRHLLSKEARKRKPSPIKTTMAYFEDPKMVFLGAGMPPAELFPINSLTFEFPVTGGSGDEKATRSGVISRLAADRELETDVPLSRALQYGNSRGQRELVGFLKEHIRRFHKIGYQDWDLITTTGSTQGWDASLRVFCDAGDSVLLEEYTYSSTLEAAEAQGHYCVGMEIDKDGIIPARLEYLLENWNELHPGRKRPKVLNTIPTGQNPTGRTLVDERKPEIYRIAQRFDMIIVEDDPYYFLQMDKYKLPGERGPHETDYDSKAAYWTEHHEEFISSLTRSFLEWDTDGRVIRLDSVTKTFAPGCRLGWLVGPKWLLDQYWNLHEVSIQSTCGFSQTIINGILNRWGQDGYINWLIHVRMEYTRKRDHCLDCCYKYLPLSFVNVSAPLAGMFFMIHFDSEKHPEFSTVFDSNPRKLEAHIYAKFIEQGVLMACGTWFQVDRTSTDNTMLAFRGTFASPNAESMDFGIKKVAEVIRNEFKLSIA